VVSVNRNIVRYNKYLVVVAAVVLFVSYCYSYCDFLRTLQSLSVCSSSSSSTLFILFLEKKFNRTWSSSTINIVVNIYYAAGFNGSGRQLNHWISLHCAPRFEVKFIAMSHTRCFNVALSLLLHSQPCVSLSLVTWWTFFSHSSLSVAVRHWAAGRMSLHQSLMSTLRLLAACLHRNLFPFVIPNTISFTSLQSFILQMQPIRCGFLCMTIYSLQLQKSQKV